VEALIVTFNPQWLYGRVCAGIEPPHTRYACLLADGPVVGAAAIDELVATIAAAGVPAVVVLTPTSVDALESPELAGLIALANDRLEQRVAASSAIAVLDETLTAGRQEYREGVGFYEMVHPTPAGAARLAQSIATTLVAEWCLAPCIPG
jgi:phospholipase/lecithinase/hemolysin